ncbi:prepilin peptidase [Clostridium aestuarii]|uniref:Prepilin peptidase n=1 Tax=Clostridium aestuarii TaxID=338193 RepID=A0ABT4D031_9CLOT|nr:A24 family peptidase [Clostridium aestuarii]MCY6484588.1 prepilin peptidase [Clostridium aestuarii]
MDYIVIVLLGLLIGSFLNVCIYRIPREESISYPPSHCTNCGQMIKPYDLIPVISYMVLKGKCRHCGMKISIRYPIIELFTGIVFLLIYSNYGFSIELLKFTILGCFLIVIGIIDFDTTDVYFKVTMSGILIGVIFLCVYSYYYTYNINSYILGALIGGGFISVIILTTHGMGWGDAEICALIGLYLGWKLTILAMFLSVILGAVVGIVLILTKKKSSKDYIPFGPYIAIGAMISVLWGYKILLWYFNSFYLA